MKWANFKRVFTGILILGLIFIAGMLKMRPPLILDDDEPGVTSGWFHVDDESENLTVGEMGDAFPVIDNCSPGGDMMNCIPEPVDEFDTSGTSSNIIDIIDISSIPAYSGSPWIPVHDNVPYFSVVEISDASETVFETYSELDELGRCGVAYANICRELMPTEPRESISSVKPSGWHNQRYDSELVEGGWIYNRCHLIGFQLAGENANPKNLITGTRYLNIDGMLDFENLIADYVKETDNHVLYRVTPIYDGDNLLASGLLLEGYSVEDSGDAICFNVYSYNVQPGVVIDYATGENWLAE